jgi:hypothetical protein
MLANSLQNVSEIHNFIMFTISIFRHLIYGFMDLLALNIEVLMFSCAQNAFRIIKFSNENNHDNACDKIHYRERTMDY